MSLVTFYCAHDCPNARGDRFWAKLPPCCPGGLQTSPNCPLPHPPTPPYTPLLHYLILKLTLSPSTIKPPSPLSSSRT